MSYETFIDNILYVFSGFLGESQAVTSAISFVLNDPDSQTYTDISPGKF